MLEPSVSARPAPIAVALLEANTSYSKLLTTHAEMDRRHTPGRRGEIGSLGYLEYADMVDENGPHYFVAFQTPGPNWVPGVKYSEQPGFMAHVEYMTELQKRGLTVLSGPFMREAGGLNGVLADGGMTIFKAADWDEAIRIGTEDPTVKSGMQVSR